MADSHHWLVCAYLGRAHGLHCHRSVPVVLAILWCHIRPSILVMVTVIVVIIPDRGWQVCLQVLCMLIAPIILLVFFTLLHSDEQLGNTNVGVISLMHHHWLEFWSQSTEEGFLGLTFQIARSEHIVAELLELHSDLNHALIVVFGQLTVGLLDAIKLV